MTTQPPERPEPFDAFETRLAARVTRHADRGVRPIDAGAVAHQAALTGRSAGGTNGRDGRRSNGEPVLGRLGWLVAGALLALALVGGASWAGGHGLLGAAPTAAPTLVVELPTTVPTVLPTSSPVVSPEPTTPSIGPCVLADLSVKIASWYGAAGNRVASVVLGNAGPTACLFTTIQKPQLVDGTGTVLIDGDAPAHPASLTLARGESVTTMVDDANYCGAAPTAPVTVAFVFADGSKLVAQPTSPTDVTGVPDCLGPGAPGMVTMHPWAP